MIKVWDFPTRVFHWLLVIAMAVCVYTSYNFSGYYDLGFIGSYSAMALHQYAGTVILSLLIFRIIWGLFGAKTARFSDFIKGPSAIIRYLKRSETATEGHNPLGAVMVLALILVLLIQVITGLFLEDNTYMFKSAPLAGTIEGDLPGIMKSIHGNGRAVLLWLVGLHVAAAFAYLFVKRKNLIRTMITGKRSNNDAHTAEAKSITHDRPLTGMIVMLCIIISTFYLLF